MLIVLGALYANGGVTVAHDLARRWTAAGANVTLLVLQRLRADLPSLTPDPSLRVVYATSTPDRFLHSAHRIIFAMVRSFQAADIVVAASEVGYEMAFGRAIARLVRRPFVCLVQAPVGSAVGEFEPAWLRPALLWANRTVDRAFCVSEGVRRSVVANGLRADRALAFPIGIDCAEVIRKGQPPQVRSPWAPPRVVAMGRLSHAKAFEVLVQAASLIKAQGLLFELLIIGEGPDRAGLESLIRTLDVADVVRLCGFMANPQPILAGADLFVLSSRYEGNGGLVLMEALAHGIPIIATDCETGPRDVLSDGTFGDLVPADNPQVLADAIQRHFLDPEPLRGKALGGPKRAMDFDQATAAVAILQEVLRLSEGSGRTGRRTGRHRRSSAMS